MEIKWRLLSYSALSLDDLYALLALRQEVFVVEQDCPYQDLDGKDFHAFHLMGVGHDRLLAYARILPPGTSYPADCSIGRVITRADVRGKGLGLEVMRLSIAHCVRLFGHIPIRISAQSYLEQFYAGLGFQKTGKEYLEDGIPHMEMLLHPPRLEKE
jgi:ElaA protein